MDWNAPNVTDLRLDGFFDEAGHFVLRIPGCTTGHVQTNDTHLHQTFSAKYKAREVAHGIEQLQLGCAMPRRDKHTSKEANKHTSLIVNK